jgi:hypothetical protein
MISRRAAAAGVLCLGLIGAAMSAADKAADDVGERIYRRGVLGSGAALEGRRAVRLGLQGAGAACVNCHQRSGLGYDEGNVTIPPITGRYLFHARVGAVTGGTEHDGEYGYGNRDPYTDATLARAIRAGLDANGRPLGELMPRFMLSDADMAALIDYLKKVGSRPAPGVTPTQLHFATIITPDADPVKRQGLLDVLNQYFIDKDGFSFRANPPSHAAATVPQENGLYLANRRWQLHIWQLQGPPASWGAQLDEDFAHQPVMAVVSGLGGSRWAPVHDFCERREVPCLFPNIEVPTVAEGDFYSLYFSKGVLLEAELIARRIGVSLKGRPGATVWQIYRAGDSGAPAAQTLAAALHGGGIEVRADPLPAGKPGAGLAAALRRASTADALVLWLRPADLALLGSPPKAPAKLYMSGLMGGLESSPLAAAWRKGVQMAYPFDMPERRVVRVDYPLGWFEFRHIPVVAEQMQADTYLACGILTETLNHMAGVADSDYLVERMQELLDHRTLTGYYPRLSLAASQSLASKGGYLVKFSDPSGTRLAPQGDWIVP